MNSYGFVAFFVLVSFLALLSDFLFPSDETLVENMKNNYNDYEKVVESIKKMEAGADGKSNRMS